MSVTTFTFPRYTHNDFLLRFPLSSIVVLRHPRRFITANPSSPSSHTLALSPNKSSKKQTNNIQTHTHTHTHWGKEHTWPYLPARATLNIAPTPLATIHVITKGPRHPETPPLARILERRDGPRLPPSASSPPPAPSLVHGSVLAVARKPHRRRCLRPPRQRRRPWDSILAAAALLATDLGRVSVSRHPRGEWRSRARRPLNGGPR